MSHDFDPSQGPRREPVFIVISRIPGHRAQERCCARIGDFAQGRQTIDYDAVAREFYQKLHCFAMSLTRNAADAADLAQDTFQVLMQKGGQIRDLAKLKSWLFTTLHRRFLNQQRHAAKFPACEPDLIDATGASATPVPFTGMDAEAAMRHLEGLDERYRLPLLLFYVEDKSYREIADALRIPIGTVMSRLSRGKLLLRHRLEEAANPEE